MKDLLDFAKWNNFNEKKNLTGDEATNAVKQDGHALRYVSNQTEAICLEAVKQDGDALRYVEEKIFKARITVEITIDEIARIKGVHPNMIKIIK